MAEKYFFEYEKESKARTTARNAAKTRAVKKAASTQLKQTNLDKTAGTRSKSGASTVAAVAKRFGVTAREARDIATAVGTLAQTRKTSAGGTKEEARKNLKKQIKEVGSAAIKGKKGTPSKEYNPTFNITTVGKKRK